jgi:hypothetical protein
MLMAAALYTMHLISYPSGWSQPNFDLIASRNPTTRPSFAAMGSNGAVAVIVRNLADRWEQGVLIVRADGTTTILPRPIDSVDIPDFPSAGECMSRKRGGCGFFSGVVVAGDGTPFVTYSVGFSGAYSGVRDAALEWNGAWHLLRKRSVLHGLSEPMDPRNISIAAAESLTSYAFVGNYSDLYPMEDLDDASRDRSYMANVSGVTFPWGSSALGIGDATAIRGPFVAGFNGGLTIIGAPGEGLPTVALRWKCTQDTSGTHRCGRQILGTGVAYGVDSSGDVVGDNEPRFIPKKMLMHFLGRPVLWTDNGVVQLSGGYGSAYAISRSGLIVGTAGGTGFIARAHGRHPHAISLDSLTGNLESHHITSAFGVSDNGRILAVVDGDRRDASRGELAVLLPR